VAAVDQEKRRAGDLLTWPATGASGGATTDGRARRGAASAPASGEMALLSTPSVARTGGRAARTGHGD